MITRIAGVKPSDIGLSVTRGSDRPILPGTRDSTVTIPGRNGAWDFGANMEPRYFALECAFITRSPSELQQRAETLGRLLVDSYGRPKNIELIFSVHPDRMYIVRYSGSLSIERLVGLGTFTLPLVAFDPFPSGLENVHESTITASPTLITLLSNGDIRTQPIIVLTNTGTETINKITLTNEYHLE